MTQTRRWSFIEATTNTAVGIGVSIIANQVILGQYMQMTLKRNLLITVLYTGISLARSYTLRRIFNKR